MKTKDSLENFRRKKYFNHLPQFKEEKTQQFTTVVLSLLAFIIFGVFGISPTLSTISQLKKQISDSQEVKTKLIQKRENLSKLQASYATIEGDLPLVEKALPNTPNVPLLTANFQYLGKTESITITHLQLSQVDLDPQQHKKNTQSTLQATRSFAFSMGIEGTYANCLNFLQKLTSFDRIVTLDSLSMTKNTTDTIIKLELHGKAYFLAN